MTRCDLMWPVGTVINYASRFSGSSDEDKENACVRGGSQPAKSLPRPIPTTGLAHRKTDGEWMPSLETGPAHLKTDCECLSSPETRPAHLKTDGECLPSLETGPAHLKTDGECMRWESRTPETGQAPIEPPHSADLTPLYAPCVQSV